MKKRYQEGGEIDAMEEANNRSMLTPRKVSIDSTDAEYEDDRLRKRAMERSRIQQQDISGGSDFIGRPQDEGYRPNAGTAMERAMLEGAYDSDKIIENTGPRTKPIVTTQNKSKVNKIKDDKPKSVAQTEPASTPKATPVDKSKLSVNERIKQSIADNLSSARSGSSSTDTRSINQRIRSALGMKKGGAVKKMASGGMASSASKRADGIAQRGKTRGKMC